MITQDRTIKIEGYTFDEKAHLHTLDGKPLTGVTTVLRVIGKGDALVNWAANCAVDYITLEIPKIAYKYYEEGFKETFDLICKEARTAHTKKKEKAGDWGTEVHAVVERYINDCIELHDGHTFDGYKDCENVIQFIKWAQDNKVKFLASEKHVYSKRMWIGGICDIICEIDGKRYVGDIKTSKGIYPEALIQGSAYASCLYEMEGQRFDGVVIINLKKDGGFDVQFNYDIEGNLKCFEAALTIYRHMEALK